MHLQLDSSVLHLSECHTSSCAVWFSVSVSLFYQCAASENNSREQPRMWMNGLQKQNVINLREFMLRLIRVPVKTCSSSAYKTGQSVLGVATQCDSRAGAAARGLCWSGSLRQITPSHWSSLDPCPNSKLFWQVSVIESYFVLSVVTLPFIFRAKSFCC